MIMTIDFGKGRVFHTPLGHADYSQECVGFITTFQRGSEWAATGKVTLPVPADFPRDECRSRKFPD
jgi:type 1 glutamine amidotransferase